MTLPEATPLPVGHCVWVAEPLRAPEDVLCLRASGGRPLTLVSNLPYELWLDGVFVGDGGHRCVPGQALADRWELARSADDVVVRLHWLDPAESHVTYRLPFADPFLADLERDASCWATAWTETGLRFAARASGHLARQNVIASGATRVATPRAVERPDWSARLGAIATARYAPLVPRLLSERALEPLGGDPFVDPVAWTSEDLCLVEWVTTRRPSLRCQSYDLGCIALHRFEVAAAAGPVVLCYSEAAELDDLCTAARSRVVLADAAATGTRLAPIGQRGCRYVHVLSLPERDPPELHAWRREYPLRWRHSDAWPRGSEPLVRAARANLVACVDGGLVDTCWRERVQWTGDMRMSAMALRALADDPEVTDLALQQIASSYDPDRGMVRGAWPTPMEYYMPPYHLAFCLAALEHDPELQRDPLVRDVVLRSMERWRAAYLRDGLLRTPAGWTFTDWEQGQLETMGWALPDGVPHAVVNAWWVELCGLRQEEPDLDPNAFEAALAFDDGYLLVPTNTRALRRAQAARAVDAESSTELAYKHLPDVAPRISPHATAVTLAAGLASASRREPALDWLIAEWRSGRLATRVTPYFGYFVAKALETRSRALMLDFVQSFYGPEAERLGTISEKGTPDDSRAHGWSVAFVSLLATGHAPDRRKS